MMQETRTCQIIGLMSGTSADGIDVAFLESDGRFVIERGPAAAYPYRPETRDAICHLLDTGWRNTSDTSALNLAITDDHITAVRRFLAERDVSGIDSIGFHGQTVFHDPRNGLTVQLGDAKRLAASLGTPVIADFRQADVAAGGEGAPIMPIYHLAIAQGLPRPLAVINLGGVSNLTFIGKDAAIDGDLNERQLLAFDCGPASALIDDWVRAHGSGPMDEGGRIAAAGTIHQERVDHALTNTFFSRRPPKSLDRNELKIDVRDLSLADGAATLTAFTVQALERARDWLPAAPETWLVAGGGRHNQTIMTGLRSALSGDIQPIDAFGLDGDAIEAQGMAYLAARFQAQLPSTFKGTTGVPSATVGGRRFDP